MASKKNTAPPPAPATRKKKTAAREPALDFVAEVVEASALKAHPRNYKTHPDDQLEHIAESIRQHGYYKNIVVARDGTILAGHGVWEAATKKLGHDRIPVRRLKLDPNSPAALKIVAADNELGLFAERDDRKLTEMLREIKDADTTGLLGTGYDDKMLAALLLNTRPASEIRSIDEAAEWTGMPDYEPGGIPIKLVITFKNEKERKKFVDEQKMKIDKIAGLTWSTRWPWTEREDASSVRFETGAAP
jgi:hypothetical protein